MNEEYEVKIAWWWSLYVHGMLFMSEICGREADEDKVEYWAKKSIKVYLNGKRVK